MTDSYCIRYTVLLDLPYFNPIDFTAIDSMHNLYLGSGKHVFNVTYITIMVIQEAGGRVTIPACMAGLLIITFN